MKVIVDIGGCDTPEKMVAGAVNAAKAHGDYTVVLVGDADFINGRLGDKKPKNIEVVHAPDVITNEDSPTHAIRQKPDSSLVKAISLLNESGDAVGLVSGGSTGAVLTGATLLVGRLKGVHRPVLTSLMPTAIEGKAVCIADCGANVDSKPEFLAQFAVMASIYVKAMYGIDKPKVALLSVGTEDKKGDERTKATFPLLKQLPLNFVGNMEARDALTGDYDVIVTDGFSGNVLLKSTEGTAKMVMGKLKQALMSSALSKIGALFMKKSLKALKSSMNYHVYGGGAFLGVKKLVVKMHGSANEVSTEASISNIIKMHENKILESITEGISAAVERGETE
ncbi:MAG: phosphate acyltransferase PlsX [Roseburia sp.]|nr:phosphate acyltransferase PlsX [Roseburia sp.]